MELTCKIWYNIFKSIILNLHLLSVHMFLDVFKYSTNTISGYPDSNCGSMKTARLLWLFSDVTCSIIGLYILE